MQPCKTKPQIDEDNRKCTHSQTNKQQQKNNNVLKMSKKYASKATSLNRDIQNKNKNAKDLVSSMLQY